MLIFISESYDHNVQRLKYFVSAKRLINVVFQKHMYFLYEQVSSLLYAILAVFLKMFLSLLIASLFILLIVVKVNQGGSSLDEVLSSNADCFHFCMCNPPFFENSEEIRKKHPNSNETIADVAQKDEIFVRGGELDFVRNILKDSLVYKNRILLVLIFNLFCFFECC